VASAFGYFEPGLVKAMWDSGRERIAPRDAGRLHLRCAHDFGRAHFAAVPELVDFCAAAESVIASVDPAGLALFAGYSAEPLPADPPARAMQLVVTLRELRGSAHLLAVVASGLSPRKAHFIRRSGDFSLFGWSEADVPDVTDHDRAAIAAADELTVRLLAPAYGVLDTFGRQSLVLGVERMEATLAVGLP
jgi:hypothetical protein